MDGWSRLREALETGDPDTLWAFLDEHFYLVIGGGLSTPIAEDLRKSVVHTWATSTAPWQDLADNVVDTGPLGTEYTFDTPRHDHYAVQILRYLRTGPVVEIGGGYGGMALQLCQRSKDVQIVLCDLPETLYLAWYHLTKNSDASIAWWDDDPDADVVLVADTELRASGICPVMVFAAHSLSEMPAGVARDYVAWVDEVKARYFYTDNAVHRPNPAITPESGCQTLSQRHPEQVMSTMQPSSNYVERWRRQYPWDVKSTRYCEVFYERRC